jgi:hypothetical protein
MQFQVALALPGGEGLPERLDQGGAGSRSIGCCRIVAVLHAQDAFGFAVADGDALVVAGRDHAADQVVEQDVVVDRAVLQAGVELRVFQAHRQLVGQQLQGALVLPVVDAAGQAGAHADDAAQAGGRMDADGDGGRARCWRPWATASYSAGPLRKRTSTSATRGVWPMGPGHWTRA